VPDPAANASTVAAEASCSLPARGAAALDLSSSCTNGILAALNAAHAAEGIAPLYLPAGYAQLTMPQQLLVIFNFERVDRGLPIIPALCTACDASAVSAISAGGDPSLAGALGYTANWAAGFANPLAADFAWLYDDGWGGSTANTSNIDCTGPTAPGCWGHRHDVLVSPSFITLPTGVTYYAGTAEGALPPLYTDILVGYPTPSPPPLDWVEPASYLPGRTFVAMATTPAKQGYWLVDSTGGVVARGDALDYGSMAGQTLNAPVIAITATPDGHGYWLLAADGGVFSFGDANFYGSTGNLRLNRPVVAMASTPDGRGYWFVASDGGVFAFGDAPFLGSMGGHPLNQPVVGMATDQATGGYWLVATDGGIFSYAAPFRGSTGNIHLNRPIVGIEASPAGAGYRMVASDGGIFSFNLPFAGSMGGTPLNAPVTAMAAAGPNGYWMLAADGGIFSFGGANYYGNGTTP
jgi:hypothetical protein